MKEPLLIYGAGGLGKEVLSLVRMLEDFEAIGFLDDGLRKNSFVKGLKVLGGLDVLNSFDTPVNLVIALGDPAGKSIETSRVACTPPKLLERFCTLSIQAAPLVRSSSAGGGGGAILEAGPLEVLDLQPIGAEDQLGEGQAEDGDAAVGVEEALDLHPDVVAGLGEEGELAALARLGGGRGGGGAGHGGEGEQEQEQGEQEQGSTHGAPRGWFRRAAAQRRHYTI